MLLAYLLIGLAFTVLGLCLFPLAVPELRWFYLGWVTAFVSLGVIIFVELRRK